MRALFASLQILTLLALFTGHGFAQSGNDEGEPGFRSAAKSAILIDYNTGSILLEKKSDMKIPPASMAKLMTIAVVFNEIKSGRLSLEDRFRISEHAWRTGGAPSRTSTMFAEIKSEVRIEDLLRGAIIQSGNDSCIALAEGISGSELAFSRKMNSYARKIGMTGSNFTNPTGLPDEEMHVTAKDLSILARHVIKEFPEFYSYFKEPEFTWNNIRQRNRNPLLSLGVGADGMKTGYTKAAGYGLVGSTLLQNQRMIVVVSGLTSAKERKSSAHKLLTWGYQSFDRLSLFERGHVVGEARVHAGETSGVELLGDGPIDILLPRGEKPRLRGRVIYKGPLYAPVKKGTQIGHLQVTRNGDVIQTTPLFAARDVAKGKLHDRVVSSMKEFILGLF